MAGLGWNGVWDEMGLGVDAGRQVFVVVVVCVCVWGGVDIISQIRSHLTEFSFPMTLPLRRNDWVALEVNEWPDGVLTSAASRLCRVR